MRLANAQSAFGERLKRWRQNLGLSQLQLAINASVSPRHLSFIETGRSQPSREMVLRLAERMRVPLREQNTLLLAAGFAPAFEQRDLDAPELSAIRAAASLVLANHEPFPAIALDRKRNIVMSNRAAEQLSRGVADDLLRAPANIYRLILHPNGLAARIVDYQDYGRHLIARLARDADLSGDPELYSLLAEIRAYPRLRNAEVTSRGNEASALVLRVRDDAGVLSFITTIATFGTPFDVTVSELVIESLFPADDFTAKHFRALAETITA